MKQIAHIDEIIDASFGLWISGLFSAISGWNPGISFGDHKYAFFELIEYMLENGKVKFVAPTADCYVSPSNPHPRFTIYDQDAQWNVPASEIINYFRERWPSDVSDEHDSSLALYFFEMPSVIWVGDTGELVAS